MMIIQFRTKREIATEWIASLFESIGINPLLGFILLAAVMLLFRMRAFKKRKMNNEEYRTFDKIEDGVLVIASLMLLIFYFIDVSANWDG